MAEGDVIVEVGADATSAKKQITELSKALKQLKQDTKGGFSGLDSAAKSIKAIKQATAGDSGAAKQLNQMSAALAELKSASAGIRAQSVANGIKSISASVSGITSSGLSNLNSMVSSINRLKGVKVTKSAFNGLAQLPSIMKSYQGLDMSGFTKQLNQMSAALLPFASRVKVLAAAWKELPAQFRTAASAARSVTAANKSLANASGSASSAMKTEGKSASSLRSQLNSAQKATEQIATAINTGAILTGLYKLKEALASCITGVNEYVESMNLAQTVMGSDVFTKMAGELDGIEYKSSYDINTGEGNGFWTAAQDKMGIDSAEAIKYQAVFEDIITGMGVARESAEQMSQQMTQLGYDISSFNNISVEQAMQKIQSGVSGELEPMRRIGYDLSVARQQQDALNLGIEGSVQNMTQAEKVQLRYYEMMTQITEAHGDLARTMTSPANQVRILQAQVSILARNVGALLLPVLNAVVPVLTAIVKLAQNAVSSIAALFGVDLSEYFADLSKVDYSSMLSDADDAGDALDDAADSTERGAEAAEEWKKQLMGFDEINNLSPASEDSSSSSSTPSSSGSGTSGGVDIPSLGYNFFEGLADDLAEKLKGIMATLKNIIPIAAGVGAAFAAWKAAQAIQDLKDISKGLGTVKQGVSDNGTTSSGVLGGIKTKLSNISGAIKGIVSAIGGWVLATAGVTAPIAAIIAAIAVVVTHFANLAINSENFRRGCVAIGTAAASAFGAIGDFLSGLSVNIPNVGQMLWDGLVGVFKTVASWLGIDETAVEDFVRSMSEFFSGAFGGISYLLTDVFDVQWTDALMLATAGIAAFVGGPIGIGIAAAILAFEGVTLAIRAVGWATSPCIEQVDALAGVSEETASRFGTSLDSMTTAFGELEKCSLPNAVVSEDDISTIETSIANVHDVIVANLGEDLEKELSNIDLLEGMLPDEKIEEMKAKAEETYQSQVDAADSAQTRLTEIYTLAAEEHRGLTEEEKNEVTDIQNQMQEQLIQTSGATEQEMSTIRENMKNNNTQAALEQASNCIQAAIDTRDKTVAAAWEEYDNRMQAAESAKEAGIITQEQYDGIKQAALDSAQSQQDAANEAYYGENGVLAKTKEGLGESAKYIDDENGNIKSNWDVTWGDISEGVTSWWEEEKRQVSEGLDNIKTKTGEKMDETWKNVKDGLGDLKTKWGEKWGEMKSDLSDKWEDMKTNTTNGLDDIKGKWSDKWGSIKDDLSDKWDSIKDTASTGWESIKTSASDKLSDIVDKADSMKSDIGDAFNDAKDKATSAWGSISDWFYNNVSKPVSDTFWSIVDDIKEALNHCIWLLNCINIPLPEAAQQVTGWSSIGFNIPYLASGGTVNDGQLFVARESGPEMVGTMGGSTTVANNDQIVEGIASGVASANASQNRLLMEQNALLRELISKSGSGATVSATAISNALDTASRIGGRPLVSA